MDPCGGDLRKTCEAGVELQVYREALRTKRGRLALARDGEIEVGGEELLGKQDDLAGV